jgi:hypothetical protein
MSIAACSSTLPRFGTLVDQEPLPPRVSDILNEVQCEIVSAVTSPDEQLGAPHLYQHVVNVNMTLDVTRNTLRSATAFRKHRSSKATWALWTS